MKLLSKIIPGLDVLKDDDYAVVDDLFTRKEHSAGDILLKPGQICKKLYFIQTGLVYAFANDETEKILWYESEGNSFTDVIGFYSQSASNLTIRVAEDKTVLASIHFDDLANLYLKDHSWAVWGTRFHQKELLRLTHYYENLRTKDASQRYNDLVDAHPEILQRIPLGHIASYLGISQVSLSRIRAGTQKK
jgi:CRP/FNR family transcriptional regulator, anaerobic regulatory protein